MKHHTILSTCILVCLGIGSSLWAGDNPGKMTFKVFTDWHQDSKSGASPKSEFDLTRVYFGYKHKFDETFSAKVLFDVQQDKDYSLDTSGATPKLSHTTNEYQAYLKNAYLQWKGLFPATTMKFGLQGLSQFGYQEHFWGYRYLFKSLMDKNKFGSSADFGLGLKVHPNKKFKLNLAIVNGEGYKNDQEDDNYKTSIGTEIHFSEHLSSYLYFDTMPVDNAETQSTTALFLGYKTKSWRLGAEYNVQSNHKGSAADKDDLTGISVYGTYVFTPKVEIFLRYDDISSKESSNSSLNSKEGTWLIPGIQYAPTKGVKMSLSHQGFNPAINGKASENKTFVSFEFKY